MTDFFTKEVSQSYDERNRRLAPIADNMHFLIRLVLRGLPARARVLCVGVGTGAEILSLCAEYPEWSFVGVDPSASMLDICRDRLEQAGVAGRCELIHGYVNDVPVGQGFDAGLSILVAHFVPREGRAGFYTAIQDRLKPGGVLVNTEISFDLSSAAFPSMLENWARVQAQTGAVVATDPDSLAALAKTLKDVICVIPPPEVESLIRTSGIATPVQFFQSFMIAGWYGVK